MNSAGKSISAEFGRDEAYNAGGREGNGGMSQGVGAGLDDRWTGQEQGARKLGGRWFAGRNGLSGWWNFTRKLVNSSRWRV